MATMLRLVLDTNVWLDWLVFHDAGIAPIKAAVTNGQAEILIDAACEQELARVLAYPLRKHALDAGSRATLLAECRSVARMLEPGERENATSHPPLPVCRDADDQKFLELARACRADVLVTRDRELLRLARKKLRPAPFRIVTPVQFAATADPVCSGGRQALPAVDHNPGKRPARLKHSGQSK